MKETRLNRPCTWIVVTALAVAGGAFQGGLLDRFASAEEKETEAPKQAIARIEAISEAFRSVSRQVSPGVVRISTQTMSRNQSNKRGPRDGGDDEQEVPEELRELFERFGGGQRFRMPVPPSPTPTRSSGSGVIVDADKGLIVTNNHVIGKSRKGEDVRIDVRLDDGRSYRAEIIGQDEHTDLAVIKIHADHLTAVPLGDSNKMEVGDWVLAIGAPFGLEQSVTQGIISAKGRRSGIVNYEDFLQTDAAINPGNSGGPLVNMKGEVIGINTAIATSGLVAGYMGVGFAIPSSLLKELLPDLESGREIVRGYLGVDIKDIAELDPGFADSLDLPKRQGVYVQNVYTDTPAESAGIKREDAILEYNGHELTTLRELQNMVARTKPGTKVDMVVWRNGKAMTLPVTVGHLTKEFFARARGGRGGEDGEEYGEEEASVANSSIEEIGVTVERLTADNAKKYGWADDDEIKDLLVVTEVEPLGEASTWGVTPGALIESVQGERITSVKQLRKAVTSERAVKRGVRISFKTSRGYETFYLPPTQ
jgi:serine protease Do